MWFYTIKRIFGLIPVMIGIVVIVSLLLRFIPGDPVDALLGSYATLADKEQLRSQLGLDMGVWDQILGYCYHLLSLDLGHSLILKEPVVDLIQQRVFPTIQLALASMLVAIVMSFPLGVLGALYKGRKTDVVVSTLSMVGVAIPNFWLGPLLILGFSVILGWFPVSGMGSAKHFVLPALTMGTSLAAILARMLRNSMLEVLGQDYIRTARAKGLGPRIVLFKHVLRNVLLPVVTLISLQFGVLLTGAIITETIFDWPGLGSLLVESLQTRDYPLTQGLVLFFAASYLLVNLATDLFYGWLDPRIRLA